MNLSKGNKMVYVQVIGIGECLACERVMPLTRDDTTPCRVQLYLCHTLSDQYLLASILTISVGIYPATIEVSIVWDDLIAKRVHLRRRNRSTVSGSTRRWRGAITSKGCKGFILRAKGLPSQLASMAVIAASFPVVMTSQRVKTTTMTHSFR
jgi:hypothetical protein